MSRRSGVSLFTFSVSFLQRTNVLDGISSGLSPSVMRGSGSRGCPLPRSAKSDAANAPADPIADTGEQRRLTPETEEALPEFLFSPQQINDECSAGHLEQMNEN